MIISMSIKLDSIEKIRQFMRTVGHMEGELILSSDRGRFNAKSALAIFTLDLAEPLDLEIRTECLEEIRELKKYSAAADCYEKKNRI